MNYKILFLVPYPFDRAPSQRLKFEQYYPFFKEAGYELTHKSFMSYNLWKIVYQKGNRYRKILLTVIAYFNRLMLLFRIRKFDIVYIHLWVTPFGLPIFEYLVTLLAKKIIYDIDDLIYIKENPHEKRWLRFIKGKNKPIFLMKRANHVITCTPYLDQFARKYSTSTTDISSTINTDIYQPVNSYSNDKVLTIGWSGSHSTSKYLYLLSEVFTELRKRHNFKLLVMGTPDFKIEGIKVESLNWSKEKEIPTLQKIDIGVYPLPIDEEWVLGKSGLKALQYMALGIPTIATGIGANFRVIEDGVSGFLVKEKEEWIAKLEMLILNSKLRRHIGQQGRERVVQHYSLKANKDTYLKILNIVTNNS